MKFNVIGAGRLGKHLAYALTSSCAAKLGAVCNRSLTSGLQAIAQIGSGKAVATLAQLPPADLTFITTADDQISLVSQQLLQQSNIKANSTIVHCSGVLAASHLSAFHALACQVASLHPFKAFGDHLNGNHFANCYCAIEGDEQAINLLTHLFAALDAKLVKINSADKANYHAAAVIAANYMVTLAATAQQLLQTSGIGNKAAQQMIITLMQSSMTNIAQAPTFAQALTGPIARGDLATISCHLQALHTNPLVNDLYRTVAKATLPLAQLTAESRQRCQQLLNDFNKKILEQDP